MRKYSLGKVGRIGPLQDIVHQNRGLAGIPHPSRHCRSHLLRTNYLYHLLQVEGHSLHPTHYQSLKHPRCNHHHNHHKNLQFQHRWHINQDSQYHTLTGASCTSCCRRAGSSNSRYHYLYSNHLGCSSLSSYLSNQDPGHLLSSVAVHYSTDIHNH